MSNTAPTCERILLVDDDQNLLDGLVRTHRRNYQIATACGGAMGLEKIRTEGPFAVIVSDYSMPGMDGAAFLHRVQSIEPDAIRVILTGNADLQTAVNAVNQGSIFRFLRKPCEPEVFSAGLNVALRQYRLQQSEKQLLEQTLNGSIQMLTEVLAMVSPTAFGRARRIHHHVLQIVDCLQLSPRWEFEAAALLSQIGCVAVPGDVLARAEAGESLSRGEAEILGRHPQLAAELLKHIPRLETVSRAVANQGRGVDAPAVPPPDGKAEHDRILASVLTLALDFDSLTSAGRAHESTIADLRSQKGRYDDQVQPAVGALRALGADSIIADVPLDKLRLGMVLAQDVVNTGGMLVVPKGQQVTQAMLTRLRNYAELKSIPPVLRVKIKNERTVAV